MSGHWPHSLQRIRPAQVSKSDSQDKNGKGQVLLPSGGFWKKRAASGAYWNREQQKLDRLYNPILNLLNNSTVEEMLASNASLLNSCDKDTSVQSEMKDFDNLPDRFKDFLYYLRCKNYSLVLDQPEKCKEKPFLLLAIKSLTPQFDRRQAIRESWGKELKVNNMTVVRVFLLGDTPQEDNHPNLSGLVKYESDKYKDILLWDYKDTFFNLTLKEVLFLKWVSHSCSDVQYIFKGDDDVFVNTHQILDYLKTLSTDKAKDLFVGDVIKDAGPHRDKKLKYYIPESMYEGSYPAYAGGGGFLYSGNLALRLYNATSRVLFFPIDDVYTGMCLEKLGLAPQKHKGFKTFDIDEKQKNNICSYSNLILVHPRKPQEMIKIWSRLQDSSLNC
ncbi:hypothetical protein GDO81_008693 [Engystomops pustulosus]|uniref:Hexosyltransferase n=1 Tax=Engystomops pustulosus TaxID=76066 RepID=A0AAV7CHD4_ENGPU|nr:hypothetical protein GDO81_008693 [Engystomops pustulosus]